MHRIPVACLCLIAATVELPGQGLGSRAEVPPSVIPIHTAAADHGWDYGLWGAGQSYKVSFHAGMTFVPYLGAGYPQNQPFSWTTASARIGSVALATVERGGFDLDGDRCGGRYDLGAIDEVYRLLPAGLHQTFVVAERPESIDGDLVIRGRLETALTAGDRRAANAAVTFVDAAGTKILSYGTVTAVDAEGRTWPMTTEVSGGELELRLPSTALRTARFPLTVDPLLVPIVQGVPAAAAEDTAVYVKWELQPVYISSWSTSASVQDSDLVVWQSNVGMAGGQAVFSDLTTSWSTEDADISGLDTSPTAYDAVAVFHRVFATQTPSQASLRWHPMDTSNPSLQTVVGSHDPGPGIHDWRVVVGGTTGPGRGAGICLAWQRDIVSSGFANSASSDAMAAILDMSSGIGTLGTPFPVHADPVRDFERPALSDDAEQSAGLHMWILACMEHDNTPGDDWDVLCTALGSDGRLRGQATVAPTVHEDHTGPVVAGASGRFLVGYNAAPVGTNHSTTVAGNRCVTVRVDLDAAGNLSLHSGADLVTKATPELALTCCSFDTATASHWFLTVRDERALSDTIYVVGAAGALLRREVLAAPGTATAKADSDHDKWIPILSWSSGTIQPGNAAVVATTEFVYPSARPVVRSGAGCSPALLDWSNARDATGDAAQMIGNEFAQIEVRGAPANAVHFLILSASLADLPVPVPIVPASCRLLVDNTPPAAVGVLDFRIGASARWVVSIPEFVQPGTFYAQDWHSDASGTQFLSTSRLEIPLVK